MFKHLILRKYREMNVDNKELVYEMVKWEDAFPFTLSLCKNWLYVVLYYFLLYVLAKNFSDIKYIEFLFYILAFVPFIILFRRVTKMANPFYPNKVERFLEEFTRRVFITPNGKALNKEDFKLIKKHDRQLYYEITSDYCICACYLYARDVALLFPDSKLIYCSAVNPFNKKEVFAHAVIERNGEIYDTNRRMSYKFEDYTKCFNLKIYKIWTHDQFSKDDFYSEVRQDFHRWCRENNVIKYELF